MPFTHTENKELKHHKKLTAQSPLLTNAPKCGTSGTTGRSAQPNVWNTHIRTNCKGNHSVHCISLLAVDNRPLYNPYKSSLWRTQASELNGNCCLESICLRTFHIEIMRPNIRSISDRTKQCISRYSSSNASPKTSASVGHLHARTSVYCLVGDCVCKCFKVIRITSK